MLTTWRSCCSGIPQRRVYASLAFMGLAMGCALRSALPIAITEMVLPIQETTSHRHEQCFDTGRHTTKNVTSPSGPVYDWDEYTQGVILSSLFWSYGPMQFVYGPLIQRFGAKYFFGQAIFLPSLITFLIPLGVEWGGSTALICLRCLMGATSSAMFPCISALTSHWATPRNRAKFGTAVANGFLFGPAVGILLPTLIVRYSGLGWPAVFYFLGVLGMAWTPFWLLLCYNNSDEHPFISEAERRYLQDSFKDEVCKRPAPAPYRHILRSRPFWAYTVGLFGYDWACFTMATDLPKYMRSTLGLSIEENGGLIALSHLLIWLSSMLSSKVTGWLLSRKLASWTRLTKIATGLGTVGPSVFILAASYVGCSEALVIGAFLLGMALMGCGYASIVVNNLDLSPNYAATLMSVGNGLACLGGILSPYLVGLLTPNQTIGEWRLVFWIELAIALVSSTFFAAYASAEVQWWNDPACERNESEMTTRRVKKVKVNEGDR